MDSSGLYLDITGFAHSTPGWVQSLAEIWTKNGLLLFGLLFLLVWWRARTLGDRAMALAVLAPLATALAYVASELLKTFVHEDRPCRAVSGALPSLVTCPAVGDWSFPSNHSVIAGAAAVALIMASRRLAPLVVPLALLMAFSRVFVGVHYPHDVALGLLFGASLVPLVVLALTGPAGRMIRTMRTSEVRSAVRFTGPGPARHG
ncbi:phosphatase PAP2 family protein [Streptomyces sp. G-G2]|uniref:phosphatase PAP2 family protein n=1 Tax=Streptomyces sp. G-G2 TaxID=3046201 RepID=UPI0024BA07CE|nr:phosphatase PAP2 family protein [Streptomyces sp. G-G2]MDJ0384909.1 phosphatase PAP2 family protein [Streptomyces sp. G-G2]